MAQEPHARPNNERFLAASRTVRTPFPDPEPRPSAERDAALAALPDMDDVIWAELRRRKHAEEEIVRLALTHGAARVEIGWPDELFQQRVLFLLPWRRRKRRALLRRAELLRKGP